MRSPYEQKLASGGGKHMYTSQGSNKAGLGNASAANKSSNKGSLRHLSTEVGNTLQDSYQTADASNNNMLL